MGKLKTHKGTQKRIKVTKRGKLLHRHAMTSHFLEKKSASRKRKLAGMTEVTGKSRKNIKLNLGK